MDQYDLPEDQAGKSAHSIYIATAVECGLFALGSLLCLIGTTGKRIILVLSKIKKLSPSQGSIDVLGKCLLSSFVALFCMKFFETGTTKLFLWTGLALYNLFPLVAEKSLKEIETRNV